MEDPGVFHLLIAKFLPAWEDAVDLNINQSRHINSISRIATTSSNEAAPNGKIILC